MQGFSEALKVHEELRTKGTNYMYIHSLIVFKLFSDHAKTVLKLHNDRVSRPLAIRFSSYYTPNGYIVPIDFRVHFFPRISAFLRRTKMHLNGMFLIVTEFFKIIVPL